MGVVVVVVIVFDVVIVATQGLEPIMPGIIFLGERLFVLLLAKA